VTAGRIIFIAGQTALDRDGNVVDRNDFSVHAERESSRPRKRHS
jgi:enamine deaminase RidA (YjgF/YER057c/UK114 family)